MKINVFAEKMKMKILTGNSGLNRDITELYACDLLSFVMSHGSRECGWITIHTHINTVAVALMGEIPCIIVPEGIKEDEMTINKAIEEGIAILSSDENSYNICWKAHEIL